MCFGNDSHVGEGSGPLSTGRASVSAPAPTCHPGWRGEHAVVCRPVPFKARTAEEVYKAAEPPPTLNL